MKNHFLILVICLLLVSTVLVGCGKDAAPEQNPESTGATTEPSVPETQAADPWFPENLPTEDPSDATEPSEPEEIVVQFEDVDETVMAIEDATLYQEPSTDSFKRGTIGKGRTYQRTGISSNGWSRLRISGKTFYVQSEYLKIYVADNENASNTSNNQTLPENEDSSGSGGPTIIQNPDGSITIDYTTTGNPFFAGGRVTISSPDSIYINGVRCCDQCEKPWGNGTDGTCAQFLKATQCPRCGAYVPALTCHSCDEA